MGGPPGCDVRHTALGPEIGTLPWALGPLMARAEPPRLCRLSRAQRPGNAGDRSGQPPYPLPKQEDENEPAYSRS